MGMKKVYRYKSMWSIYNLLSRPHCYIRSLHSWNPQLLWCRHPHRWHRGKRHHGCSHGEHILQQSISLDTKIEDTTLLIAMATRPMNASANARLNRDVPYLKISNKNLHYKTRTTILLLSIKDIFLYNVLFILRILLPPQTTPWFVLFK